MNSTQHSIKRSRVSLANVTPGSFARISLMIFWTVALFPVSASRKRGEGGVLGHPSLGLPEAASAAGAGGVGARDHGEGSHTFRERKLVVACRQGQRGVRCFTLRDTAAWLIATHLQTRGLTWLACTKSQDGVEAEGGTERWGSRPMLRSQHMVAVVWHSLNVKNRADASS